MRLLDQVVAGLVLTSVLYLVLKNATGANTVIKAIGSAVTDVTTVAQGR